MPLMLETENVNAFHGKIQALRDISIRVSPGELVSIIGANGAGKSTLLDVLSGLLDTMTGRILFQGEPIQNLGAHAIVKLGLIQIPERSQVFPRMTVSENLDMGAFLKKDREKKRRLLDLVFSLFPVLKERSSQMAGRLSGGEQQMLAVARGLMGDPKMLTLDEPSLGLAPLLISNLFGVICQIQKEGVTILLVEQNVYHALRVCTHGFVMENGSIRMDGPGMDLLKNEYIREAYLGI